jgi:hypothetical protein
MYMSYSEVRNPQWSNAENTIIQCDVKFDALGDKFHPFSAVAFGDYSHTHEIFSKCITGEFGVISPYQPPAPATDEQISLSVRTERDRLLSESDWTQLPDVSEAIKNLWLPYRQSLRDITIQSGFPQNVSWPIRPS